MGKPNVLLICVDHWPGRLLGAAGHPAVLTPTLDQLAANGARFAAAYADCPVCVPSRRSLMSGLHPSEHGSYENKWGRDLPEQTLAQCFRDAGYQAYAVGKLHIKPMRGRLGFDDVLCDEEGRAATGEFGADDYELFLGDKGYPGQRFDGGLCNNDYFWRPWHLEECLHPTNWAEDAGCAEVLAHLRKRLLAHLSDAERDAWTRDGELRGTPEEPFAGHSAQRGYLGQRGSHWPLPGTGPVSW